MCQVIPHIHTEKKITAIEIKALLDSFCIPFHQIDIANWEKDYPYKPRVSYRMAHTGDTLLLHYYIEEKTVRAVAITDNGKVWEDSCCEFFISPDADEYYYNFECNAATRLLLHYGKVGERVPASAETLASIDRWSSLGEVPFQEKVQKGVWELTLVIPVSALFHHQLNTWEGLSATGNLYKCGDKLSSPHFLATSEIAIEKPCFHCPAYFIKLKFD